MTAKTLSTDDRTVLMTTIQARTPEIVQDRTAHALLLLAEGLSVGDKAGPVYLEEAVVAGWQTTFAVRPGQRMG